MQKSCDAKKNACIRAGRALNAIGMPEDADGRMPVVTITGGNYVRIENHTGILLFTDCCVRLYSRIGIIRIEGKKLVSRRMDGEHMTLEGEICAVRFEN